MNVRHILSVGVAIAMLAFATSSFAQSMNGTWEVTGGTMHGKSIPSNVAYTMVLKVADNSFVADSGNLSSSGKVTANPQAALKQITFVIENGDDPGRELKGIYKFEGQAMTITFSAGGQFPTSFDSTADNKYLTLNYQIGTGRNQGSSGVARNRPAPTKKANQPGAAAKSEQGDSSAAAF